MTVPTIGFRPMTLDDVAMVDHWLQASHTQPWWRTSDLEEIVQAARGAKISVRGVVTAQASVGGLPWHFRANLPRPLTFSAAI